MLALAGFGVISLALLWGYAFRDFPNVGEGSDALQFTDAGSVLLFVCYAPLLLWAPLLAAVTFDYARRTKRVCRRRRETIASAPRAIRR